jgi:CheY-like chemotaxis protein
MAKQILYIDDDEIQKDFINHIAKKSEYDFNVDFALTGEEGVQFYDLKKYDLIVIDLSLPDIEGTELASKIKAKNLSENLIFVSGAYTQTQLLELAKFNPLLCIEKSIDVENDLEKVLKTLDSIASPN